MSSGFERYNENHVYYMNNANELCSGALKLFDGGPVRVARMLAGFSLELLLKATSRVQKGNHKSTHDLEKLCQEVAFEVPAYLKKYLEMFTRHAVWEGRYPAARTREAYLQDYPERNSNNPSERRPIDLKKLVTTSSGEKEYKELWSLVMAHYQQVCANHGVYDE